MRDTDLFQLALGLQSPWTVTRSEFAVEDGRLDLYVDFPRGSRFACAECGREGCAVHDTKDETWRHLDFFQHGTLLHARVPRVSCPNCGVRKVATPWARAGSGFTLLFEAYVLALAKAMPIANAAKRLGEHDTRLWRDRRALRLARGGGAGFVAGAAHRRRRNLGAARPRLCQPVRRHGAAQSHLRGRRQGRRDGEGIRGFPRGARRQARGGDRRQHRHGGGVRKRDQG